MAGEGVAHTVLQHKSVSLSYCKSCMDLNRLPGLIYSTIPNHEQDAGAFETNCLQS